MKTISLGVSAFILAAFNLAAAPAGAAAEQPNIVYIVADDLGWGDVGFHGSDIRTPVLDGLAADGADLTQYYAQPMCTPTRAALLTGRYPFRYGLQSFVILPEQSFGLPKDERLLPEILGDAGYDTALIGKWHLGHADPAFWPQQRGFDIQYGPLIGEIDYFTHEVHGVEDWYADGRARDEPGYSTTLIGEQATEFIESRDGTTPFFLYLAFNAPHTPFQAPEEALAAYADIPDSNRRAYAAMISAMDAQIGAVVDALEAKGLRDDTLIVFQSDNGGVRNAAFAGEIATSGELPARNGPFRGGKGDLFEGGTRVVALANWPGRIKPGKIDGMMHVVDMLPTLSALAGATTAGTKPLDGSNVWKTISEGAPSPRTEVVYNIEMFRGAVREGDWKLIWRTPLPASLSLFDIADDPSETTDKASEHPEVVGRLQDRIEALAKEMTPSLFFQATLAAYLGREVGRPVLPNDDAYFTLSD